MKKNDLVYIATAYDDSRIFARRADLSKVCEKCDDCAGEDLEDGAGCLVAFYELAYKCSKFIYKKEKS